MEIREIESFDGQIIKGLYILKPNIFKDDRGFFMEIWNKQTFNSLIGENIEFVQDNHAKSLKGVIRGLHYQIPPFAQGKLVRCVKGKIYDVAVDLRRESLTFKKWVGITLDAISHHQVWIPPGFAHGYLTLSEDAEVLYKTNQFWNKNSERSIVWNDPILNIKWPIEEEIKLSEKDSNAPKFNYLDI